MPKFSAHIDLVTCVRAVCKYSHIRSANAGIEILYQHIVIANFGQVQFPDFDGFFA